jgi:hypothetical protein
MAAAAPPGPPAHQSQQAVDRSQIPVGPQMPAQPLLPAATKMKDTKGNDTDDGYSFGIQGQEPTMECVKRFVQEFCPGDDWQTHLAGFAAEFPQDASGAIQFTSYGKPKCFQAEVTFKVDIQTDTGPKTIEFTQVIKTGVQIPIGGDDRAVKEASIKAVFMLEGYRHAIKEPIYEGNTERIEHLAQTKILYIKSHRSDTKEGFYGKNIRWEQGRSEGSISAVIIEGYRDERATEKLGRYLKNSLAYLFRPIGMFMPNLFYFETSHYQKDQTYMPPQTIWNTKIECAELVERDRILKELENAAFKKDQAKLAQAAKDLQKQPEPGLTPIQIVTILTNNGSHALEQLDINLEDSPLNATSSEMHAHSLDTLLKAQKETPDIIKNLKSDLENLTTDLTEKKRKADRNRTKEEELNGQIKKKKEDIDLFEKRLKAFPDMIKQIKSDAEHNFERQKAILEALTLFKLLPEAAAIQNEIQESIDALKKLQNDFDVQTRFDAFIAAYDTATNPP